MTWLAFALAYAALATLALAMTPHHRAVFGGEPPAARRRVLRAGGWLLFAFSFVAAIAAQGWEVGPVLWCAELAAAGFGLTLLLAYAPRRCAFPLPILLLAAFL
jgi:hypothetical protein